MQALLLAAAPPPTLRLRRPLSSGRIAPAACVSAPLRTAGLRGAVGRGAPSRLAAAAPPGPAEPEPAPPSAEEEAERAKLAQVKLPRPWPPQLTPRRRRADLSPRPTSAASAARSGSASASSLHAPRSPALSSPRRSSSSLFSGAFPPAASSHRKVSKRLEKTARYFKSLGTLGFWSQLVCTTVSAGILSFSAVATGNATSPFTFYLTALGIVAAFFSVFRSFGYIRLSERLGRTSTEPAKAPPRADVVKNLRNSIALNVIGMGAALLGMQATVGALVAKALTTSSVPYYQGISAGQSPVLALDVFLVQASANTILSHFLGLSSSLELLRSVTISPAGAGLTPRPA